MKRYFEINSDGEGFEISKKEYDMRSHHHPPIQNPLPIVLECDIGTPPKRFHCEETTLDLVHDLYTVRLWINNDNQELSHFALLEWAEFAFADYEEVKIIADKPDSESKNHIILAECLARKIPHINAVQVKFKYYEKEIGIMIYTVPF